MISTIKVTEVAPKLLIGNQLNCFYHHSDDIAVIHACTYPCHQYAVGYRKSLPSTHPDYWLLETRNHLYLNIVDAEQALFFSAPPFIRSLAFIKQHIGERKVLIHSNQGLSRAPSIALLYLAKETSLIDGADYDTGAAIFSKRYPQYQPKRGIVNYLRREWDKLNTPITSC